MNFSLVYATIWSHTKHEIKVNKKLDEDTSDFVATADMNSVFFN